MAVHSSLLELPQLRRPAILECLGIELYFAEAKRCASRRMTAADLLARTWTLSHRVQNLERRL